MASKTPQTVTLTQEQLQSLITEAVSTAMAGAVQQPEPEPAPKPKPKPAKAKAKAKAPAKAPAKARTTPSGRKALYQSAAAAEAPVAKYGAAPAKGTHAADIAKRREAALEAAIPGVLKAADIQHLGKSSDGQYLKSFAEMDRHGVGFWTWIRFPAKNKAEADKLVQSLCGLPMDEVGNRLKACGYAWSGNAKAWRCKTNGQPARGGRHFKSEHAERVAFADDE